MSVAAADMKLVINRAKAIAAMGLVERDYEGFNVISPGIKKETFRIWRDEDGRVRCNCPDFEEQQKQDPRFRCEHILAVKFHLEPPDEAGQPEMTDEDAVSSVSLDEGRSLEPARFAELLKRLSGALSPELIRQRIGWKDRFGRDHEVDYVEWHTVADLLDRICPEWSHQVNQIKQIGDYVAVTASITIEGVTRQGVGTGSAYDETGIKKAEHDALKRAAVKFGLARELYRREDDFPAQRSAGEGGIQTQFSGEPVAKTIADLVTPKQLVAIRAIANAQKLNAETECQAMLGCRPEELSRRAASAFIDHLKSKNVETDEIRHAG
ncbi:MAG TPA: Rad52/Rad22 family DNA repair protein [Blastocatellia bacterium]|nr:Rad52/Rad22 family DNA repair protein [Blastocatellia bacterium]